MKIGDGLRGFCLVCSSLPSHCAWKMVRRPESVVCSNQLIIPRQTQAARPRRLPEFGSAAAAGRSAASFHIHRLSTSSPPPSSAPDVRGTLGTLIRNLNKRDKQLEAGDCGTCRTRVCGVGILRFTHSFSVLGRQPRQRHSSARSDVWTFATSCRHRPRLLWFMRADYVTLSGVLIS